MSGTIPKIMIETENSSRPNVKIENPINVDGIKISNSDSDSDDSVSTVETKRIIEPNKSIKNRPPDTPRVVKRVPQSFNPIDYENFMNTSKTKKLRSETYSEGSSEGSSESGSFSDSEVSSESSESYTKNSGPKIDKAQQKKELLLKLYSFENRGIELSKKFSMNSKLSELQFEYEIHKNKAEIGMSIKFQQKILIAFITGLEFANKTFDPIGAQLDGWSESVMDSLDDYDEIFIKLHEKYKDRADLPPELHLLVTLAGSAFMFHMTKTFFSSITSQKAGETSEILQKIMSSMSKSENSTKDHQVRESNISGPSYDFSNMLKEEDSVSSGSVETSKEVTVTQRGKRAINL